jgi:hypothetical protein
VPILSITRPDGFTAVHINAVKDYVEVLPPLIDMLDHDALVYSLIVAKLLLHALDLFVSKVPALGVWIDGTMMNGCFNGPFHIAGSSEVVQALQIPHHQGRLSGRLGQAD